MYHLGSILSIKYHLPVILTTVLDMYLYYCAFVLKFHYEYIYKCSCTPWRSTFAHSKAYTNPHLRNTVLIVFVKPFIIITSKKFVMQEIYYNLYTTKLLVMRSCTEVTRRSDPTSEEATPPTPMAYAVNQKENNIYFKFRMH